MIKIALLIFLVIYIISHSIAIIIGKIKKRNRRKKFYKTGDVTHMRVTDLAPNEAVDVISNGYDGLMKKREEYLSKRKSDNRNQKINDILK